MDLIYCCFCGSRVEGWLRILLDSSSNLPRTQKATLKPEGILHQECTALKRSQGRLSTSLSAMMLLDFL